MADSNKSKLVEAMNNVYAQDPTTRLRALEQTEPIYDTSPGLVSSAASLLNPAISLATLRAGQMANGVDQAQKGNYGNAAYNFVRPFMPGIHSQIIGKLKDIFGKLPEGNIPYFDYFRGR